MQQRDKAVEGGDQGHDRSHQNTGAFFQSAEEREPSSAGEFGNYPDFMFEIFERKRSHVRKDERGHRKRCCNET